MRADGRTLFELIYHDTPIYAVDRQPLFCTFCARAQNVSKQSCHLGPSGPNGKIREKMKNYGPKTSNFDYRRKLNYHFWLVRPQITLIFGNFGSKRRGRECYNTQL